MKISAAMKTVKDPTLRTIYNCLHFDGDVVNTPWRGAESKNSLSFEFANRASSASDVARGLKTLFGVDDSFCKKAEQAGSGSATEWRRLSTLHSSALCALLHFWKIDEDHQVTLCLDVINFTFSNVFFEIKNIVYEAPSSLDVVLTGCKDDETPVVLYLESKFSEHIRGAVTRMSQKRKEGIISGQYFDPVETNKFKVNVDRVLQRLGLEKLEANDHNYFFVRKEGNTEPKWLYAEGIKQIIAHYLGICKEIECHFDKRPAVLSDLKDIELKANTEYYLGTILFDFQDADNSFAEKQRCYSSLYHKLAVSLNESWDLQPKLRVMENALTYQEIQSNLHLAKQVEQFYYGPKHE